MRLTERVGVADSNGHTKYRLSLPCKEGEYFCYVLDNLIAIIHEDYGKEEELGFKTVKGLSVDMYEVDAESAIGFFSDTFEDGDELFVQCKRGLYSVQCFFAEGEFVAGSIGTKDPVIKFM